MLKTKMNGLGFKMSVWFVAVCAFPAISILAASLYVSSNILLDKSLEQLTIVANGKKNQLTKFLSDVYLDVDVLSDIGNVSAINAVAELEGKAESTTSVLFEFFESVEINLEDLSASSFIRNSITSFSSQIGFVDKYNNIDTDELERIKINLSNCYSDGGSNSVYSKFFSSLDDESIILQYYYLSREARGLKECNVEKPIDQSGYLSTFLEVDSYVRSINKISGYDDVLIVDTERDRVMYTASKGIEYGVSVNSISKLSNSNGEGFYDFYRKIKEESIKGKVYYSGFFENNLDDVGRYFYASSGVFRGGELVGICFIKISTTKITSLLSNRFDRNGDSVFVLDINSKVIGSYVNEKSRGVIEIDGELQREWNGGAGSGVRNDFTGESALMAWRPFEKGFFSWVIVAERPLVKAFSPDNTKSERFYKEYIDKKEYSSMLLVDSNGVVVYDSSSRNITGENLFDHEYEDTNIRDVYIKAKSDKRIHFSDFNRLEKFGNQSLGFFGKCVSVKDDPSMVYIVVINQDVFDSILDVKVNNDLGSVSYLVGGDNLLRSNYDRENSNYLNSGIDSAGVNSALSGEVVSGLFNNIENEAVLGVYLPLQFGGYIWGLASEFSEDKVFEGIEYLKVYLSLFCFFLVFVAGLIGVLFSKRISNPLSDITYLSKELSLGNLTINPIINRSDEIGILQSASKDMTLKLRSMVSDIASAAKSQTLLSNKLADIASETTHNVQAQNDLTKVVVTASEILNSSITEVSELSKNASFYSGQALSEVNDSNKQVRQVIDKIDTLKVEIDLISKAMLDVKSNSENISDILYVVNNIASQTSLLALNASIEASRAGRYGEGFAVVAEEIRNLSLRTTDAIKDIELLINKLQLSSIHSSDAMIRGQDLVDSVVLDTKETESRLDLVLKSVEIISEANAKVESYSTDQYESSKEIIINIHKVSSISKTTGENSRHVLEISKKVEELSSLLNDKTSSFRL